MFLAKRNIFQGNCDFLKKIMNMKIVTIFGAVNLGDRIVNLDS